LRHAAKKALEMRAHSCAPFSCLSSKIQYF